MYNWFTLLHNRKEHNIGNQLCSSRASQVAQVVKNPPAKAGDIRGSGSNPVSARSRGGGNRNSIQYSCLENSMDRGAWRAIVHRVVKSWTWLKSFHTHIYSPVKSFFKKKLWKQYLIFCISALLFSLMPREKLVLLLRIINDIKF